MKSVFPDGPGRAAAGGAATGQPDGPGGRSRNPAADSPAGHGQNPDSEGWSEFPQPAEAGEFPWAPAQQFWQGFISTSKVGQKSGLFIAVFDPHSTMSMNDIHQSASSSFGEDGAYLGESGT